MSWRAFRKSESVMADGQSEHSRSSLRPAQGSEYTFPSAYILYLGEAVKRWHVTVPDLLEGTGLAAQDLDDPKLRVSLPQFVAVLERARKLSGEPAIGYHFGYALQVSAHGSLGTCVRSAPNVREAIELAIQFWPLVTNAQSLRLRVENGEASIIVEEHADFGSARDIVLLSLLVALSRVGNGITGTDMRHTGYADIALPPPEYASRPPILGSRVRFGQPVSRLVFTTSCLTASPMAGDPIALRFASEECARTMDTLDGTRRTSARVQALLGRGRGGVPSVSEVAAALGTSPRTLKRQLAGEGTSFSTLVETELRERALLLLRSNSLSTKDVAATLGYSNVSNFTRAFVRWTGKTPTEQRLAR
jgi:AraC-like DNA-binding protein